MEIILSSFLLSICLRLALLDVQQLQIRAILVGIWEGLCLHHVLPRAPGPDPFLALALRLFLDFLSGQTSVAIMITVLWSALSILIVAAASNGYDTRREAESQRSSRPRARRSRHIDSVTVRHSSASQVPLPALFSPQNSATRPPSPPSIFLEESPSSLPNPLPTPPLTYDDLSNDPHDFVIVSSTDETSTSRLATPRAMIQRLSPVPEESLASTPALEQSAMMAEDITPEFLFQPPNHILLLRHESSPLPSLASSSPQAPNTWLLSSEAQQPHSPVTDPDPLQTPRGSEAELDLGDSDHDELQTPLALTRPLSPLHLRSLPEGPDLFSQGQSVPDDASEAGDLLHDIQRILQAEIDNFVPIPVPGPHVTAAQELAEPVIPSILSSPSIAESVITNAGALAIQSKAEQLRREAWDADLELQRLLAAFDLAQRKNHTKDVFLLRGDIADLKEKIAKLHRRAERRYLHAANIARAKKKRPPLRTIDVHGLLIPEAIRVVEQEFRQALRNDETQLRVIVGKGNHSKGGVAKLKPAIVEYMTGQNFTCTLEPNNTGVVVLSCPP
ncbi:hypothetical protein C8J56DRAFT_925453 [Mycena floridula]|nr:hypothetical protein C8J56DRAFT_925453 [Mycena floridula]